jgi:hypothetical protein
VSDMLGSLLVPPLRMSAACMLASHFNYGKVA